MRHLRNSFSLFFSMILLSSCNKSSNPIGPVSPKIWTQEQLQCMQIPGVSAVGNVPLAGAYHPLTSYGFFFRSTANRSTWMRVDSVYVGNHKDNDFLWLNPWVNFLADGTDIFDGIGYVYKGDIYRSTNNGIDWTDKGINWQESDSGFPEDINAFATTGGAVFAGTNNGVFRSTENGRNWALANVGFPLLPPFGLAPQVGHLAVLRGDLLMGFSFLPMTVEVGNQ